MTENLMDDTDVAPEIDPNKNYLEDLVGEGKKFKSPEELAKGKYQSDSYIKILEKRLDEMRSDYLKARDESVNSKRLEDLIEQLSKSQDGENTPKSTEEHQPIDSKQIESLVSSKIQEHELSRQQATNFSMVRDRLKERYGNTYKTRLEEQIEDLGITEEELNTMARRQPKVLLRTLGLDRPAERQDSFQSPISTSQRRDSFAPTGQPDRTWSYYKKMKQENPQAWFDRKTAVQMQEDAIRLGDKFYDGDFYVKGLHQ